jgi:hypothetical protein
VNTSDWAVNNPEYSIPAAVIGAPVALAATPMIVSYALFPFASGASYVEKCIIICLVFLNFKSNIRK